MKTRIFSVIIALLVSVAGLSAQDMDLGIDYFMTGETELAEELIGGALASEPAKANYYLGEIAYKNGDFDKARSHYEAGKQADSEYIYNQIGLAKLELKSNAEAGKSKLHSISRDRQYRKDADVFVAMARAYYDNNMTSEMNSMIEGAEKADRRAPSLAILRGDILRDADEVGKAASEYGQAILRDKQHGAANIKIAQLYLRVNPKYAIEKLEELQQMRPGYPLADKYLAKAYYYMGQYDKAIETYERFYAKGHDQDDLTSYAAALFFTDEYGKARTLISEGLKEQPDNFVLNRLSMYSAVETEDHEDGLAVADKFFSIPLGEHNEYILRDYATYADLLLTNGRVDDAIKQFYEAIEIADNSEEIANTAKNASEDLYRAGYPREAADFLEKYIESAGETAVAMDYYTMGNYLYRAAATLRSDTVDVDAPKKMTECLNRADEAFGVVSERIPDSYLGPIFRARVNSLLDPETTEGLARPYYEQTLKVLLEDDESSSRNKTELLEAYRYLSYYHYLQFEDDGSAEDKAITLDYSKRMLELDPQNSVATQLIDALSY